MIAPNIQWPPRDEVEKERLVKFVLHELDRSDATLPYESEGTGLMMRLLKAWDQREEREEPAHTQPRKRGRPKKGELDRLPGLEEFIAIDAERIRALFREHWGKSNYTRKFIPSVSEIVVRRWHETAEQHGMALNDDVVATLLKRNKSKQRRLAGLA